jgi:EmrB/QacA subfamily drug resistance transporter
VESLSPRSENGALSGQGVIGDVAGGEGTKAKRHPGGLLMLLLLQFMIVVDTSIVNVALPDIGRDLGLSATNMTWVVTGYALAFGGLILLSGKLGDLHGPRRMIFIGTALFVGSSVLGGIATSGAVLILARCVQGLGAALVAPSILVMLMAITRPGPDRSRAIGFIVLATAGGAAAGLVLGGVLTSVFGWRAVMFVNVPIGVAILLGTSQWLSEQPRRRSALDIAGAVLSTGVMVALVYGFTSASARGWTDTYTLAAGAVALVAGVGLLNIESRRPQAVLPLQFFSTARSAGPLVSMLVIPAGQLGFLFFATLFTQRQLGYSPLETGLLLLPFTVGLMASNAYTPSWVARYGERVVGSLGLAGVAVGIATAGAAIGLGTEAAAIAAPSLVIGIGAGLTFAPVTAVILHQAPTEHLGAAASITQGFQQLGGSLGLAVLTTIYAGSGGGQPGIAAAVCAAAGFPAVALMLFATSARRVQTTGNS